MKNIKKHSNNNGQWFDLVVEEQIVAFWTL